MKFISKNEIEISKELSDLDNKSITISQLELQIAFKEEVLKSPKDLEDARHLRNVAAEHLNMSLINNHKRMLHEIY